MNANSQTLSALGNLTFATGAGIVQDAWVTISLASSWVAYGGAYVAPRYVKDKQGVVHVNGSAKSGTYADGTTVFTLPAGYRPVSSLVVTVAAPMAGGGVNVPQAVIGSDGTCKVYNLSGAGYLHLSFSFPTF